VRQWRARDYQAPLLKRAALVAAARKRDWSKLPEMLAYVGDKGRDEVFATSLIRLMGASADERIAPVLRAAAKDPSPLVRGAAVDGLALRLTSAGVEALLDATGDEYRLVRVRAAAALAGYPRERLAAAAKERFERAEKEYLAFIVARPDQWTSHYNLGNYRLSRGETREAVASFEAALKLEPRAVMALVNASIAYGQAGAIDKAEKSLQEALTLAPENAAANFNMGLVQAEKSAPREAERYLRQAIKADPQMAQAAYNLCIITSTDRIGEAVTWCRKAVELVPQNPAYAYTLAFYLSRKGDRAEAIRTLEALLGRHPGHRDAELLLGELSRKNAPQGAAPDSIGR
jgi:tetratricopeptide (TPR) repeat protein